MQIIRHVLLASAALALTAAHAGPAPLLAAWPFEEGRGQATREAVSARMDAVASVFNHARFQNASGPLWRDACVVGGCLLFDGYSNDVVTPAALDLALLGDPGDRVLALRVWQMAAIQNKTDRR